MASSVYTKAERSIKSERRIWRTLWSVVMVLALIGIAVVVRRTVTLVPILVNGYTPPAPASNPVAAQFAALDDIFARYPVLTLIHIIPGVLFMLLGPLQFNATIRARHLQWHRWSGRVYLLCSLIIGVSALVMSVGMPAIGGLTQAVATTLFALLFLFALGKAYWHVRHREIVQHREWMIRAFAIGLAVATIRPIIGLFFATSRRLSARWSSRDAPIGKIACDHAFMLDDLFTQSSGEMISGAHAGRRQ